ncbi:hypothetical protein [Arthrobacter castelli]|uniref:hypothetical protein n=1 Tax=Arthrobacter castelli TaxID=271431 RepID=UPI000417696C|nr:hypothetical protein [Arthrobacter castelli]
MHHSGGPGWDITVDTSSVMLTALYLRDAAGLEGTGTPAVSPASPKVRTVDPRQTVAHCGGVAELRDQWSRWWKSLATGRPEAVTNLDPPEFSVFTGVPALQRFCQAHYGAAMTWGRERRSEYTKLQTRREATGRSEIFANLVEEREMELGRDARAFTLNIIELPLSEARAWYIEPQRLIMSQSLPDDEEDLRSFVQPVIELLV